MLLLASATVTVMAVIDVSKVDNKRSVKRVNSI